MALRCLPSARDRFKADFDRLLEEWNPCKLKIKQLTKLILENDAAMIAMYVYLQNVEKSAATLQTQTRILSKSNGKL